MPATLPRPPHSRATVFLTVASLVSVTVLLVGLAWPALHMAPRVAWRVGDAVRPAAPGAVVSGGTPIGVHVELPFAAHVYVASWSPVQGTIALFPSERLALGVQNPLPAGRHWLPGTLGGKDATWPVHSVVGPIHYLVVASREPLPELEATLHRVRQMGQMVNLDHGASDRGMYVFAPDAGMKVVPTNDKPAAPELDAARTMFTDLAEIASEGVLRAMPGRSGVFVRPLVLQGQ